MVERGIYELSTWVAGMRYLQPALEIPSFFKVMGFTEIPAGPEEIRAGTGDWRSSCTRTPAGKRKTLRR
ncbi:MAG: hypothetical protein ACYC0Q_15730 [Eubacteriales bacterium]